MRFSWIALAAFVSAVAAQGSLSNSPDSDGCFENCFRTSGCAPGDEVCYCNNQVAVDKTACCVSKECSGETQKIIGVFAHLICQKGSAKHPPRQADGCKKGGGAKQIK
ncbi:uncharacterized protein BKA78DRAFT_353421 [Phyllosticta capitalensis]|uniref:uncharacterized protein n=1 Tax=Phyllosticta capitalensis TaxID=121624 RepID=UPI003131D143